jgi:hypothetical protein
MVTELLTAMTAARMIQTKLKQEYVAAVQLILILMTMKLSTARISALMIRTEQIPENVAAMPLMTMAMECQTVLITAQTRQTLVRKTWTVMASEMPAIIARRLQIQNKKTSTVMG